jgi:hypothetical protein
VKQLGEILDGTKIEMLGVVDVKGPAKEEEMKKILELADTIMKKLEEF